MMKIIFLLVLGISSVFGGWFSSSKIVEKQELNGEKIMIVFNTETNETRLMDTKVANRSKNTYYQELRERGNQLFSFLKDYGRGKGFKSFSITNKYLSPETGFIFDNTEDIVRYCTMGKDYTNFCSAGNNGILGNNTTLYYIDIVYYIDNSGQISF